MDDAKTYKNECTHLIVGNPTRSEKFLSACAAGRWILTQSYVLDSGRQGRWLDEGSYEWTPERGGASMEPSKVIMNCHPHVVIKSRGL